MIGELAQQIATQLAPVLPYLVGPMAIATKEAAAKATGSKISEAAWNNAVILWNKIRPAVEKEPEVAKALQEVAKKPEDPRAETIISWQLEKILAAMPPEELNEIRGIVYESKGKVHITMATNCGVAIGGNATGNTISTGDSGTK